MLTEFWRPIQLNKKRLASERLRFKIIALERDTIKNEFANWFSPWRFAGLLFLLIAVQHPDVLLGSSTFYFRDYSSFGYPLAFYHREAFWRGEIPLWNPLSACGIPFLAQWNTLVFYPGSLLYLLFPLPYSLAFYCLAHQFFAGMAMYFLARNWTNNNFAAAVAGMSYSLSGLLINSLMWPNNIAAFAWMPLVVLANELAWERGGRMLLVAALVSSCQMLAGAPEIIVFTWLINFVLFLRFLFSRQAPLLRVLLRGAFIPLLTAGICAIQLLPFLQFLGESQRGSKYVMSGWDMPATGWGNFILPLFQTMSTALGVFLQADQQWTSSYYLPIILWPLVALALFRKPHSRVWVLGLLLLVSLILALGENWVAYVWLKKVFPGIAFMRFPVKLVVLTVFVVPLLGAFGIAQWNKVHPVRSFWIVTEFISLLLPYLLWHAAKWPEPLTDWDAQFQNAILRGGLLWVCALLLLFLRREISMPLKVVAGAVLLMMIGADGLTNLPRQNPTIPISYYRMPPPGITPLPKHGTGRAFLTPDAHHRFNRVWTSNPRDAFMVTKVGLFANANLLYGVPKVDGFYSLHPQAFDTVSSLFYRFDQHPTDQFLDFLNVVAKSQKEYVFEWEQRATAMPILTGGQRPEFKTTAETFNSFYSTNWNPRQVAFFHTNLVGSLSVTQNSRVTISAPIYESHRIAADFDADAPSLILIAQNYYSNWKAFVDGNSVPLYKANHAFQAVQVPAGKHHLEILYQDTTFRAGVIISLTSLFFTLLFWFFLKQKPH